MKIIAVARALALACGLPAAALNTVGRRSARSLVAGEGQASPLQQTITLLGGLAAKVKSSGEKEEKAFAKFQDWCKNGAKDKQYEIKTAKASVEELSATIAKASSDISVAKDKLSELASEISTNEADLKSATAVRGKEKQEFMTAEAELLDVIDTLDRAINLLEKKLRGSALVQEKVNSRDVAQLVKMLGSLVDAASLSTHDKTRLMALAQSRAGADEEDEDDQEPDAYKMKSGGIVDVLEDMREKAETQLAELRKEEVNGQHNYEMMRQSVEDQISVDEKDLSEAKSSRASSAEVKATAQGDLAVTQKDLKDAEDALKLVSTSCMSSASDHEASMKARGEELHALAAATDALQENAGGAAGHTYSFLQVVQTERLGSRMRLATRADLANFEVVNLVRRLAKKDHSAALTQLAGRIAAAIKFETNIGSDPFGKVKTLILDMVTRLEQEATGEASHKAYCDKEMAGTKAKLEDLNTMLEQTGAKVDKKKALSVKLKGEVQELQAEMAGLHHSQGELVEVRREENANFEIKKVDLETGLKGVRQALRVLREYYADGSDAGAALLQSGRQQPGEPEYHSKSGGAAGGIVGLLEVVESDFGKSLAQSEMEEDAAAVQYEKISMKNKISNTMKGQDVKYKDKEAANLDKQVVELSSDGTSAQTELDAVLEVSKTLRGQCIAKPESYEERKARRDSEVAGLKEALNILEGEAVLLQRPQKILRALRGTSPPA